MEQVLTRELVGGVLDEKSVRSGTVTYLGDGKFNESGFEIPNGN